MNADLPEPPESPEAPEAPESPEAPGAPESTDDVVIPALLRGAPGSYAASISAQLTAAGFDDLPRNGGFVLGGMANWGGSAADMVQGLGISKQSASQLIDALVLRGYLTREVNPHDRRRMLIGLTERGRAAAVAVRAGVVVIDAELAQMISPAELAGLRAGLEALGRIKDRMTALA
jgi:DNA-binding MarR family transcriptional regulator